MPPDDPLNLDSGRFEILRQILEMANDAILLVDAGGNLVSANRRACELMELPAEEIVGSPMSRIALPEELPRHQETLGRIWHGERVSGYIGHVVTGRGAVRLVECSAALVQFGGHAAVLAILRDVTDRQEAEERLRAIVEHATDTIYIKDLDGRYVMINPSGAALFGFPAGQIVGRRDADLFPAAEVSKTEETDRRVMATGQPASYVRQRTFHDRPATILMSKVPYRGPDGSMVGLIGIGRDVSDQIRAEEELRLFRDLVDQSDLGFFAVDPRTSRFLDVNDRTRSLLGYEREELLKLRVIDVETTVPTDDAWKQVVGELRKGGSGMYDGVSRRKDGSTVPVEVHTSFISRGGREYMFTLVRDITDRKKLEAEVVEAQRHYQELYDSAPVMLLQVARDGTILDCNRTTLEVLGVDRGEVGGRPISNLAAPESRAQVRRLLQAPSAAGEQWTLLARGGRTVIVTADAQVAAGTSGGVRLVMRDVTAAVRQENALQEARAQLEVKDQMLHAEKLRALGEMISGVAHELNNPLGTIMGFAELMLRQGPSEDLQRIHQEAVRCSRIVNNLLRFARRDAPRKSLTDVRKTVMETLELRAYHFRSMGVTVQREMDQRLPPTYADEGQLAQVFLNLINNSVDAVSGRGAAGLLRVRTWSQDDRIFVAFIDNGSGIPKDRMGQIFDPFFTTKEPGHGTGLGLSVAYGIIQDHQGRITAESEVGVGTTITVELPVRQESTRLQRRAAAAIPDVAPGHRILVVEDEASMRKLLHDVLTLEKHIVVESEDAATALRLLEQHPFDLVISDIKMPAMSGVEFYERLRRSAPALAERMIFITGDVLNPTTREFLRSTHHRILEKPCSIDSIRREVAVSLAALPPPE